MIGWLLRRLKKRGAIKKIDAYREIPVVLREMAGLQREIMEKRWAQIGALPLEERKKVLAAISRRTLSDIMPRVAEMIERGVPEADKDRIYVEVMSYVAERMAPIVGQVAEDMLGDIEMDCKNGIDQQLDVLRGLQKDGKGGISGIPE